VDEPAEALLAACYDNALRLADEQGITSIAFPAISTGAFGYPAEEAARVCAETVKQVLPQLKRVGLIRFVLFDDSARKVLQQALAVAGLI
jgi:O-acetyl-ADP-ribose deacetylase (regulator of RNase III)